MSVVKGFLGGTPTIVGDALLTVPSGIRYKILNINVNNRTAAAATFALFVSPGGSVPADNGGCFCPDLQLNGRQGYVVPNGEGMLLDAGDAIYGESDTPGALGYQISFAPLGPSLV